MCLHAAAVVYIYVMKSTAFSLIELLVVVAIIAILASLAIPYYQKYTLNAKLTQAVTIMLDAAERAKIQWTQRGGNVSAGSPFTTYTPAGNVSSVSYFYPGQLVGWSGYQITLPSNSFLVAIQISGLTGLIPGYNFGSDANANLALRVVENTGGSFTTYCGRWVDSNTTAVDTADIPTGYLPPGCNCRNIYNLSC